MKFQIFGSTVAGLKHGLKIRAIGICIISCVLFHLVNIYTLTIRNVSKIDSVL